MNKIDRVNYIQFSNTWEWLVAVYLNLSVLLWKAELSWTDYIYCDGLCTW